MATTDIVQKINIKEILPARIETVDECTENEVVDTVENDDNLTTTNLVVDNVRQKRRVR